MTPVDLTIAAVLAFATSPSASRFARLDDLRVHYQSQGQGRAALVLVHGWSCNLNFWKHQALAFASKTRVISIDLPGHGESDKPEIAYTMDLFARAIDAVLRDAGVRRATLVGHSMGTPVVRQFYRKYRDKTRSLVLVDGSLRPYGDRAAMEKFAESLRGPNYQEAAGRFVDGMLQPVKDEALRAEIRTAMLKTPQHVGVSAVEGMADPAIWQDDAIEVPVLAIHAASPFWTADYEPFARRLARRIDFQMWEGVSHFLMIDDPRRFNEALEAFLVKNQLFK